MLWLALEMESAHLDILICWTKWCSGTGKMCTRDLSTGWCLGNAPVRQEAASPSRLKLYGDGGGSCGTMGAFAVLPPWLAALKCLYVSSPA